MKKILIIVPAYQESGAINKTLTALREAIKYIENYQLDIVVINDCSTDSTAVEVRDLGIPLISLPINLGIGGAMQTGFRYCNDNNYHYAIQFDGDGQHNPADIGNLIKTIENQNVDMVIGSRFIKNSVYKPSIARMYGMKLSSFLLYVGTGKKVHDTTSGFRIINRRVINYFSMYYPARIAGVISLAMMLSKGFTILEVEAKFNYRTTGKSSIGFGNALFYPIQIFLAILGALLSKQEQDNL